jgi:hypothetical protein
MKIISGAFRLMKEFPFKVGFGKNGDAKFHCANIAMTAKNTNHSI